MPNFVNLKLPDPSLKNSKYDSWILHLDARDAVKPNDIDFCTLICHSQFATHYVTYGSDYHETIDSCGYYINYGSYKTANNFINTYLLDKFTHFDTNMIEFCSMQEFANTNDKIIHLSDIIKIKSTNVDDRDTAKKLIYIIQRFGFLRSDRMAEANKLYEKYRNLDSTLGLDF